MFKYSNFSRQLFGISDFSERPEEIRRLENEIDDIQQEILMIDLATHINEIHVRNNDKINKLMEEQIEREQQRINFYKCLSENLSTLETDLNRTLNSSLETISNSQNRFLSEYFLTNFNKKAYEDCKEIERDSQEIENMYQNIKIVKEIDLLQNDIKLKREEFEFKQKDLRENYQLFKVDFHEIQNELNKNMVNLVSLLKVENEISNIKIKINKFKKSNIENHKDLLNTSINSTNSDEEEIEFVNNLSLFDAQALPSDFSESSLSTIKNKKQSSSENETESCEFKNLPNKKPKNENKDFEFKKPQEIKKQRENVKAAKGNNKVGDEKRNSHNFSAEISYKISKSFPSLVEDKTSVTCINKNDFKLSDLEVSTESQRSQLIVTENNNSTLSIDKIANGSIQKRLKSVEEIEAKSLAKRNILPSFSQKNSESTTLTQSDVKLDNKRCVRKSRSQEIPSKSNLDVFSDSVSVDNIKKNKIFSPFTKKFENKETPRNNEFNQNFSVLKNVDFDRKRKISPKKISPYSTKLNKKQIESKLKPIENYLIETQPPKNPKLDYNHEQKLERIVSEIKVVDQSPILIESETLPKTNSTSATKKDSVETKSHQKEQFHDLFDIDFNLDVEESKTEKSFSQLKTNEFNTLNFDDFDITAEKTNSDNFFNFGDSPEQKSTESAKDGFFFNMNNGDSPNNNKNSDGFLF